MSEASTLASMLLALAGGATLLSVEPPETRIPVDPHSAVASAGTGSVARVLRPQRGRDGRLYVAGTLNGERIRFLLDTGARQTVLSAADARRAGIEERGTTAVQTVSGTSELAHGIASSVIIDDARFIDRRVLIAPELNHSLMGMDIVGELNAGAIIL